MFDDVIVVYKFFGDLMFYVTGSQDENELILYTVLQAFYESISLLLRCRWRPANLFALLWQHECCAGPVKRFHVQRQWHQLCDGAQESQGRTWTWA